MVKGKCQRTPQSQLTRCKGKHSYGIALSEPQKNADFKRCGDCFALRWKMKTQSKSSLHQNRKQKAIWIYPIKVKWRNPECKFLRLTFNAEIIVHAEISACFWISIREKGKTRVKLCHLHSTLTHFLWGISHLKLVVVFNLLNNLTIN